MSMSLEDLKRANAVAEQSEQAEAPQPEPEMIEEVEAEPEAEVEAELPDAETDDEAETDAESQEEELESWMTPEEESESSEPTFHGSDIAAAKNKLRAKLEKKHNEEVEELKAQLQAVQNQAQVATPATGRPKLEDFYEHDDPEAAHDDAVYAWRKQKEDAQAQQSAQSEAIKAQKDRLLKSVENHYTRAQDFIGKHGITEETYQASDANFRKAIDAVMPGHGDAVTDMLIDIAGEDSHKVSYLLGINKPKREHLQKLLKDDPNGLKAAAYIGKLGAEISSPAKRTTTRKQAKPAPNLTGGTAPKAGAEKKFKKAYDSGDTQQRINAKFAAKEAGFDTSKW